MKPLTKLQVGASRCLRPTPKLHPSARRVSCTHTLIPTGRCSQPAQPEHFPSLPTCHHCEMNRTYSWTESTLSSQSVSQLRAVMWQLPSGISPLVLLPLTTVASGTTTAPATLTPDKPPLGQEKTHQHQAIKMHICCKITISSPPLANFSVLQR